MTEGERRAALIIKGLGGQHLAGFLPGADHKAAIARAVSGMAGWLGPGTPVGRVIREGIGEWPHGTHATGQVRPADALVFVTWREVIAVVERGSDYPYLPRYCAAYEAWCAACRALHAGSRVYPDDSKIRATTEALIRHGCRDGDTQGELF